MTQQQFLVLNFRRKQLARTLREAEWLKNNWPIDAARLREIKRIVKSLN